MTMAQHSDIRAARVAAEKKNNTLPSAANAAQQALLNALEIKVAELKLLVSQINAAGGLTDTAGAAALASLAGSL